MSERSEMLRQVLAGEPTNTFARYALAVDYASSGRLEDAVSELARLVEIDPNYTAAYYQGGKALERLGRQEQARDWYERGVAACQRAGNAHALSEMRAALEEITEPRP